MKQIFILVTLFSTIAVCGQAPANRTNVQISVPKQVLETDSALKVIYTNKGTDNNSPAYFLNGKFVGMSILTTLDPQIIDNIDIVKDSIQIDNVQYNGQILIKTKSGYSPKIISMTDLKDKYTNLENKPVLFMIDGNIVNADYDKYMVDENHVLQIIVSDIKNTKQNIDIALIKLLTRSPENIKKSKEILIRGNEVAVYE